MSDFDLIIFDCDGTLVDSEGLNNAAFIKSLHEFGVDRYSPDYALHNFTGMTISNILLRIQMEIGVTIDPKELVPRYIEIVEKMQREELNAVKGAYDFVEKAAAHCKICVGSNGERSNVLRSLALTNLNRFFTEGTTFTRIQVPEGKPAPDLFLYAAQQMGMIDPARCLVIEDSESGVQAGVAAGMTVWGFTGVTHDPEEAPMRLKNVGAVQTYDDFIHMGTTLGF